MMKITNFFLTLFSIVFSIYLAECILYTARVQPYTDFHRGNKGSHEFEDTRSNAQFVHQARLNKIPMVPDFPPHNHIKPDGLGKNTDKIFPLGSIANRPTAYCNVYGKRLVYQSDQYGFRNPNSVHSEENTDIVIVGDSFSAGHCEDNDIGTLMRGQGFKTLNAAYGGNGPLIELAALREYGLDTKPKVILWIYFEGNDLKNLKREAKSDILKSYLDPSFSQSLKDKQTTIDSLLNEQIDKRLPIELAKEASRYNLKNIIKLKGVRFKVRQFSQRIKRRYYPLEEFEPYLPLFNDVMSRAKADAESIGSTLFFVYLPQRERYGGPINELKLSTYQPEIMNIVKNLDIKIIDFGDVLDHVDSPRDYFPYGIKGHYNQAGYVLLSEQISPRIRPIIITNSDTND